MTVLTWFCVGLGVGLGLLSSVLLIALMVGVLDYINHKLKWYRTIGGKP